MTTDITITHEDEATHGTYRVEVEGADRPAVLTWRDNGSARVAEHTFTPPQGRGKGIAGKLVRAMIADAREQGFKVLPLCPYVAVQFDKHPEWADLRATPED